MVGHNADVSKGIANGTLAILVDVILKETASVRIKTLPNNQQLHAVYANDVLCIVFKHQLASWKQTIAFPTLELGCFPVIPIKKSLTCKLGNSDTQSFKVNITRFPCVSAMILTGYKVQGQSLHAITLGTLTNNHKFGKTGWIYVILSRVRSYTGLFLLVTLPTDPRKYKPRVHVMKEMSRLRKIEKETLKRITFAL